MMDDKKDDEPPQYPNNVERTLYEIAIEESGKRIDRLQQQCSEFIEISEKTENEIISTDIETADQIAQINRSIAMQQSKIDECQQAIKVIKNKQQKEKDEYDEKSNSWNKLYEETRLKLLSKLKILNAKINNLEDFKITQVPLEDKLQHGNELMALKEQNFAEKLNQLSINFNVNREKLIEKLRHELFKLSATWTTDTLTSKTMSVRRLFHENLAIRAELDRSTMKMHDERQHCAEYEKSRITSQQAITKHQQQQRKALMINKVQTKLIKVLINGCEETIKRHGKHIPFPKDVIPKYDILIDELQCKIHCMMQEIAKLTVVLDRKNIKIETVEHLRKKTSKKIKKINEILYNIKYTIACGLQLVTSDISSMTQNQLIDHLNYLITDK